MFLFYFHCLMCRFSCLKKWQAFRKNIFFCRRHLWFVVRFDGISKIWRCWMVERFVVRNSSVCALERKFFSLYSSINGCYFCGLLKRHTCDVWWARHLHENWCGLHQQINSPRNLFLYCLKFNAKSENVVLFLIG